MARPSLQTPTLTAEVAERLRRGETRVAVAAACGVSKSTVDRVARVVEAAKARAAKGAKPAVAPSPTPAAPHEDAGDIPEGASPEFVRKQIARVEAMVSAAQDAGNVAAFSSLMQRLIALLAHQHRTAPPPIVDPNANPDMIEARERGRRAMHALIDQALKGS